MKWEGLLSEPNKVFFSNSIKNLKNPWQLRAEGLERKLEPAEWSAVIYHIIKHPGFQSNRRSITKDNDQSGAMLESIKRNEKRLAEKCYHTAGEMVYRDDTFKQAKRNKRGNYNNTFSRTHLLKSFRFYLRNSVLTVIYT